MKICLIADTHGMHKDVIIPECDVLLHAGDVLNYGDIDLEFYSFANWFNGKECKLKIAIGGNHDGILEKWGRKTIKEHLSNCIYLENEAYILPNGMKLYGSPFTPRFMDWWFMYEPKEAEKMWDLIPPDTDILLTHGPSHQHLDEDKRAGHLGCKALARRVEQIKPKYHIFGHIHRDSVSDPRFSQRIEETRHTTYINCGLVDNWYDMVWDPIIIEVPDGKVN